MQSIKAVAFLAICGASCSPGGTEADTENQSHFEAEPVAYIVPNTFDFQGHRGCRGLLPENSIPGFLHALDLDVVTLEMDVVISADRLVVVSHDPWFSSDICLLPDGREIGDGDERNHLVYQMDFEEVQKYDCGAKGNIRFPEQRKMSVYKPLLSEVLAAAELHARETGRDLPFYNIETKCTPKGDGLFHPEPDEFAQLVVDVVREAGVAQRTTIQSFDNRTLKYLHGKYPELRLALLVENREGPEKNLDALGFLPHIYSPEYTLVDSALVRFCKNRNMLLIPWTVNDADHMRLLIELGVDGIISDYPNRFPHL